MNRGKTVFLRLSSCLAGGEKKSMHQICDKTSFHGLGGDQPDMACWHTCVSNPPLGIYGKTLEKVSTHSEMRAANFAHDMCVKSKYESDDKSRDEKEWNASEGGRREKKKEETNMRNCRHFSLSAVGLVRMCIFFKPPSLSQRRRRRGEKCLSQCKIATILYYYYCKPTSSRLTAPAPPCPTTH